VLSLSHVDCVPQLHYTAGISNTCCRTDTFLLSGYVVAQAVHSQPLTAEAQVESQASLCGICGAQSGTRTGVKGVLHFSHFTVIPPKLCTEPFIHHHCYKYASCCQVGSVARVRNCSGRV